MNRDQAIARVLEAIRNPGPVPYHHHSTMNRHRAEWPTLWRALDELARADAEERARQ